jgi:hypothetical protein
MTVKKFRLIIFFIPILAGLILFLLAKKKQETIEIEKRSTPYTVEYVKNLIYNSSFELGRGNEPSGWMSEIKGDKVYLERDVIEKFDRKFSASITSNNPFAKSNWFQDIHQFPKEKKFILYGAIKTYYADSAFLRIEVYDTLGNLRSFNSTEILTGTNDWKVYTCAVIVEKDAKKIRVKCVLNGKGSAWFDDVELVAVRYEERDYPFWWKYWTKQFQK